MQWQATRKTVVQLAGGLFSTEQNFTEIYNETKEKKRKLTRQKNKTESNKRHRL